MMDEWGGAKELYDIKIKLNQPLDINDRHYDINETILSFDKAEIAQMQQGKSRHRANGGFNNNLLIEWETDREMSFLISHGVLSATSWALLSNSKIKEEKKKSVSYDEIVPVIEQDDYWYCLLKYIPNHNLINFGIQGNPDGESLPMGRREWLPLKPLPPQKDRYIFCYDADTGKKIEKFEIKGNMIIFKAEHKNVIVDYTFDYINNVLTLDIGNRLLKGFLKLTAKMTIKDYLTGEPRTAILSMPRIKLQSNLIANLGLGFDCATVSDFAFIGYPDEGRLDEQTSVCSLTFLPTELTGDYL